MFDTLEKRLVVGRFEIEPERWIHGELTIDGADSNLYLRDEAFFHIKDDRKRIMRGELHDLTKVTLVKCNTPGTGSASHYDRGYNFAEVFPHYVLHGDAHIDALTPSIAEVSFEIDDAAALFYDYDHFASLIDARPHIAALAKAYEEIVQRPVAIGERPKIAFFTGKRSIFEAETVIGRVSALNCAGASSGSPRGVRIDNTILCKIVYAVPVTLQDATVDILRLLRFFEMIVGRPQTLIETHITRSDAAEREIPLRLYWSLAPKRSEPWRRKNERREPQPFDMLMTPAREPDAFARVLADWLARDDAWMDARLRFSGCFAEQNSFGIDRIVAAANMFDILPEGAVPKKADVPDDLRAIADATRKALVNLPQSPERDSLLAAIGRLGDARLKHKVRARAQIVTDALGARAFPELPLVCDKAVNCRNYFVHGGEKEFDYANNFTAVMFMTLTLEMVFALSDLIDCGWNPETWASRGTTKSHPIGALLVDYKGHLAELKRLLNAEAAAA